LLPKQRRLGVLYALTAGAGIGLTVLAVPTVIGEYEPSLVMIFLAGFLGFLTAASVCGSQPPHLDGPVTATDGAQARVDPAERTPHWWWNKVGRPRTGLGQGLGWL
jgi:hypothetical protein